MAIGHLLGKGHTRIALVNGQKGLSSSADRVSGWKRALRRGGAPAPKEYVQHGDWTAGGGYAAMNAVLELPKPVTAVFTANFLMMTGVLKALKERGLRCPEDIEVMSSDDSEWLDVFEPRISTIAQPSYEMGSEAAGLLLKRIKSPNRNHVQIVLPPQMVLR
jgi:DNA-binding LacI/PurR family transcriptional regulator